MSDMVSKENNNDRISLLQYENLRVNFQALIIAILGEDYYNEGMDVYTCDNLSALDIACAVGKKERKKFIETYTKLAEEKNNNATR